MSCNELTLVAVRQLKWTNDFKNLTQKMLSSILCIFVGGHDCLLKKVGRKSWQTRNQAEELFISSKLGHPKSLEALSLS